VALRILVFTSHDTDVHLADDIADPIPTGALLAAKGVVDVRGVRCPDLASGLRAGTGADSTSFSLALVRWF
jgi:hypothetical protein